MTTRPELDQGPPLTQRFAQLGETRVAYLDTGTGPPLVLLHGCPFSSFVWRGVVAELADQFRCIAPDLLGLGDTETPADADWTLPAQAHTVLALLDHLGLDRVALVGHDHGGAVAQLVATQQPARLTAVVLADAEAYDNWPSAEERPFVRATQLPVAGRLVLWAWSRRTLFRWALGSGQAVYDRAVLTDELVDGYIAANLADPHRRAKTRRFLATQLDPGNQAHTQAAADALPHVRLPALILWGERDVHFGPEWGRRLHADIPGSRLEILPDTGHLLMEERPAEVAALIAAFVHATAARG
ncbi:alpha/beta fold hydrolase [Yinghuangia seranimata]|uniref:alpha/beta fold hydrolase n=1 Tax=Yinghuangia seranimata TaxID=408067 RepID=UPI00248D319E|nr:alpha/beta fold hydrolase [Yinghuangia seranimata]MDI2130145.1 alpha/beta fold hydrolase [Yinghuangia seranimata]